MFFNCMGMYISEIFLNYNTKGYSFSIRCIPEFAKLKYSGTILSYVLITLLFRVLIGMYIGIVLGILSQVFIIPIQNISCGVLLFILPLCLCYIGQMGYENPLIHFINIYLSSILKPIKFLTSFPSKWFLTGKGGLGVFIGIPIILIYVGWLMWKKQYKY